MWYMEHMLEFVACGCNMNKGGHKLCKQSNIYQNVTAHKTMLHQPI